MEDILNPKIDWTIGAQLCRDLHNDYAERACEQCPLFNEYFNQKFGGLETIISSECNMFTQVVSPLLNANLEVKSKDQASYNYFKQTGTYKYF